VAVYSDDGLVGSVFTVSRKDKRKKKAEKHTHESCRIIKKGGVFKINKLKKDWYLHVICQLCRSQK
jgi:hypothetical protein